LGFSVRLTFCYLAITLSPLGFSRLETHTDLLFECLHYFPHFQFGWLFICVKYDHLSCVGSPNYRLNTPHRNRNFRAQELNKNPVGCMMMGGCNERTAALLSLISHVTTADKT
jgi:hypothetical protein